jgi:hypothetical protein
LFPGGFARNAVPTAVLGMSVQSLHHMLTSPYSSLQRFDAGVHIRAQTNSLEHKVKKNSTQFSIDLHNYETVFHHFDRALFDYFFVEKPPRFNWTHAEATGSWPRVFISCDDVDVRTAFIDYLSNHSVSTDRPQYVLVYVNTTDIKHVKNMKYDNITAPEQGLVDTAFDWYSLSLSQVCFAWRSNYSPMVSTFMQSATRVSILKPTAKDFKSKILHRNMKFEAAFDYVDTISEVLNATKKKHKGQ